MPSTIRVFCLFALLSSTQSLIAKELNGFDISNLKIDRASLVHGGPPRDAIPAIDSPHYVSGENAQFMLPRDRVIGVEIAGEVLAYPLHILNWHELVNAQIGDQPFLISYCPLCGTGMAFHAKTRDQALTFGVSGLLYNSDLVFYDRETESLWSQIHGEAIAGPFAGHKLEPLAVEHARWSDWLQKHPRTKVLSEQQGFSRNYRDDPYRGYANTQKLFFKIAANIPADYHTKEYVLGLAFEEKSIAFPFSELRKHGKAAFTYKLGNDEFEIRWNADSQTATAQSISGKLLPSTTAFWFAWYAFYPETNVFKASDKD